MTDSVLALFARSGDDHVGQTLVRLAELAAQRHAVAAAWQNEGDVFDQLTITPHEAGDPAVACTDAGQAAKESRR